MNKYKRLMSALLVFLMLFSLASCGGNADPETSDKPEGSENISDPDTSETAEEETTEEEALPTALELLIRADQIAEEYTSAVQTVTNKMTMAGNPIGTQVSVTKKDGNNCSYTVSTDGYASDSVVLKDGEVSYYSDIHGAFILSGADLDDFELLINGSDAEMFDYSNAEYFTDGTVTRTESGYDVTIEFSEAGKQMLAQSMGVNSAEATFKSLGLSAKIAEDGSSAEQKLNMEITMSVQGMNMTLKADAEMVFSNIGENVAIDEPMSGVSYIDLGDADNLIALLNADARQSEAVTGSSAFEFDRYISVILKGKSLTNALYNGFNITGAYDPEKGMNYFALGAGTDYSLKYYSDNNSVIVEQGGKRVEDPTIRTKDLFFLIVNDLDNTNYGIESCSAFTSVKVSGDEKVYTFELSEDIAEAAASSYLSNYITLTASAVKIKSAVQTYSINAAGEYSLIGLNIEAVVVIDNIDCEISITDKVTVKSYETATITPIVAD